MTEQDRKIIPFMHCLAVAVNTALEIKAYLMIQEAQAKAAIEKNSNKERVAKANALLKSLPRHEEKRLLNLSMKALDELQYVKIDTNEKKNVAFLDIIFSDSKQVVGEHTDFVLEGMTKTHQNYIALCLVIHLAIQKIEGMYANSKRRDTLFWDYYQKVYLPVRRYFNNKEVQDIAGIFMEKVVKLINV